jgi:hypothetical protein
MCRCWPFITLWLALVPGCHTFCFERVDDVPACLRLCDPASAVRYISFFSCGTMEYKYILTHDGNPSAVTWQPGSNMVLVLNEGTQVRQHPLLPSCPANLVSHFATRLSAKPVCVDLGHSTHMSACMSTLQLHTATRCYCT